jgi:peptidyl-prolyl cis-trans isomerase B (cyclophilin B)
MRLTVVPILLLATPLALAGCSGDRSESASSASANPSASAALPTSMTIETNRGTIVMATDPAAPKTVAAQAALAQKGYFDDTPCHRLVTSGIFVLQCGDPTGTGTGDPGYTLPDENLPQATKDDYPAGTVAMANAGPNTGGSQFFIVYKDTTLPPAYTVWGKVTSGLDVVSQIAADGTANGSPDGPPKKPVTITSVTVD